MAISMRLKTRRRTAVATAKRLPCYVRNDKVGTQEQGKRILIESVFEVPVIPAKAGIQVAWLYVNCLEAICMDSRFRENDRNDAGMTIYQAT